MSAMACRLPSGWHSTMLSTNWPPSVPDSPSPTRAASARAKVCASCGHEPVVSPWRAFYRRIGDVFVIAAVGAEADPRGFARAVTNALTRLQEMEPS